jgi:hypothetical protein
VRIVERDPSGYSGAGAAANRGLKRRAKANMHRIGPMTPKGWATE